MSKNPIVHFEIGCSNVGETRDFLQGLFSWEFGGDDASPSIETGLPDSLSGHLARLGEEWGHYVTFYVRVDSLEEAVEKTRELGGRVLVEPVLIEDRGRFAWIAPPEGQIIGLWEDG